MPSISTGTSCCFTCATTTGTSPPPPPRPPRPPPAGAADVRLQAAISGRPKQINPQMTHARFDTPGSRANALEKDTGGGWDTFTIQLSFDVSTKTYTSLTSRTKICGDEPDDGFEERVAREV